MVKNVIRYFLWHVVGKLLHRIKFLSSPSEYDTTPLDVEISTFLTLWKKIPSPKSAIKY